MEETNDIQVLNKVKIFVTKFKLQIVNQIALEKGEITDLRNENGKKVLSVKLYFLRDKNYLTNLNDLFSQAQVGLLAHPAGYCFYTAEFYQKHRQPVLDGGLEIFPENMFDLKNIVPEFQLSIENEINKLVLQLKEIITPSKKGEAKHVNKGLNSRNEISDTLPIFIEPYTNQVYLAHRDNYQQFLESLGAKAVQIRFMRYLDFNGTFQMLNNSTFRMSSIQGMNDQTEGANFIKSIYEGVDINWLEETHRITDYFNNIFISSCTSSIIERLTMWRLYGENSSGCALELNIVKPEFSSFTVRKVIYTNFRTQIIDAINQSITAISNNFGLNVNPQLFFVLALFLKDKQYEDEKEIRMLYNANVYDNLKPSSGPTWGIVEKLGVVRPYVDFHLEANEEFPIRIKKIILGPNCKQAESNLNQFILLNKRNGPYPINIQMSELNKDLYIG